MNLMGDVKELHSVATVPTVYGIETKQNRLREFRLRVATVPTVYGIETPSFCLL